eukprot:44929-Eustigmatos_ZCMA.PRE.1
MRPDLELDVTDLDTTSARAGHISQRAMPDMVILALVRRQLHATSLQAVLQTFPDHQGPVDGQLLPNDPKTE